VVAEQGSLRRAAAAVNLSRSGTSQATHDRGSPSGLTAHIVANIAPAVTPISAVAAHPRFRSRDPMANDPMTF
jgi:hypothetical protein